MSRPFFFWEITMNNALYPGLGMGLTGGTMPGLTGIPGAIPGTMEELRQALANGTLQGMTPAPLPSIHAMPTPALAPMPAPPQAVAPQMAITEERMAEMMDAAVAKHMPGAVKVMQAFESVFQRALAPDDYKAFVQYTQNGSPGFDALMASDKLYPLAQLLWEEIKGSAQ